MAPGILHWHPGENPQEVFRQLANDPAVIIDRFEVAEPSLDDIFITVVKEGVPEQLSQVTENIDEQ